ncbi:tumor necrosis factor receptor superfamily member 11B [Esox lucius]|uniref:TNFR-Cys domain-containing protein n=1 Tax=Esox lucius TaxID=8010 RepID=A0A3P9AAQ4_ESOLU|nr:tumor necrosis factor receptor superfamily member 11B [Esox lucius]
MTLVFMVMFVSAHASIALHDQTFQKDYPHSGPSLVCDQCPPGTYLRAPCSSSQKSDCAKCPDGSFTELWNSITKCLRCSMCDVNQVVTKECSSSNNCQCECKEGYFFNKKYDACVKHKECMPGYGVNVTGTPHRDTQCALCQPGFYSDGFSAKDLCVAHRKCEDDGFRVVLKGREWHDTLCASCQDLKTRDGAEYLHEILPTFFIKLQQTMGIKKMRRFGMKLSQLGGKTTARETIMKLSKSGLNDFINSWVQKAGNDQVRKLPEILGKIGSPQEGEKLQCKLEYIEQQSKLCDGLNE